MTDFNHLFTINEAYWGKEQLFSDNSTGPGVLLSTIARLVSAPESQVGGWGTGHPLRGPDFIHYFEAIPAGQLTYPQDVKFLIGKVPDLFGTLAGAELQQWCKARNWVLVWSLGMNTGSQPDFFSAPYLTGSFPSNKRLLDPTVLPHTSVANVSLSNTTTAFNRLWMSVQQTRALAALQNRSVPTATWAEVFGNISVAVGPAAHLEPLRAASCADEELCVGTDHAGKCVCYAGDSSHESTGSLIV